jgi:hypothetical protein
MGRHLRLKLAKGSIAARITILDDACEKRAFANIAKGFSTGFMQHMPAWKYESVCYPGACHLANVRL